MNMFSDHALLNFQTLQQTVGVRGRYRRDTSESAIIIGVPDARLIQVEDADGAVFTKRDTDLLLLVSELVINAQQLTPEKADEFDLLDDQNNVLRTLRLLEESEPWDYEDANGVIFRIHFSDA